MPEKEGKNKKPEQAVQARQPAQRTSQEIQAVPEPADRLALGVQLAMLDPSRASPRDMLGLQRAAGNRAVSRLIQAKLTVGPAGDHYEQEADRVAEQVLNGQQQAASTKQQAVQRQEDEDEVQTKPLAAGITPLVQRQEDEVQSKPLVQRQEDEDEVQSKPLVQRQEDEDEVQTKPLVQRQEDEEEVQTKPLVQRQEDEDAAAVQTKPDAQRRADGGFDAGPALESRLAAGRGNGRSLPGDVRGFMEDRFGADFGGVQVHAGPDAAQLSRQIQAQAFTHGRDIYMGAGRYEPGTEAGKRLLAHELTHVVQQGGATARRKPAGIISRQPAAAIQRNGTGIAIGSQRTRSARVKRGVTTAAETVGRGIVSGAETVKTGVTTAAETVGRGVVSGVETVGRGVASGAETVATGVVSGAKAVKEFLQPGAEYVADKARAAATYVSNKLWSVHLGLREIVEPVKKPASIDNLQGAHDYAGELMYAIDGHKFETTRNLRFLEQDEIAIQEHFDQTEKTIAEKKLAITQVKEPTGRMARIQKTAQEQKAKLQRKLYDLTAYKRQLQDEMPKAADRVAQARLGEDIMADYQLQAGRTYDDLRRSARSSAPLSDKQRTDVTQVAQKEQEAVGVRNTVSKATNNVRESGRSERFFTNGLAKLIGGKVANIALQTATLTMLGVDSKDRPGGYSSTIKVTNLFSKTKAEILKLHAIRKGSLYGNKAAAAIYATLRGISTVGIVPARDIAAAISLLSTGIGAALGAVTLGAAAAPFTLVSTISGYVALGLTGLNALLNTAMSIWNGIRLHYLQNQRKRAELTAEGSRTASTAISESLGAAAQGVGVGLNVGLTQATMGSQAASDIARGVRIEGQPLWITITKTGVSQGINIPGQAVPGKVAGALSPESLGYKEAHEGGLHAPAYRPHGSHGVSLGGHKVGVPHPKFMAETVPAAAHKVGEGAQWAGGKVAEGAQWAGGKAVEGAQWAGGKIVSGAETVRDVTVEKSGEVRDWTEREFKAAREWAKKDIPALAAKFATLAGSVATKIGKVITGAKSVMNRFASIKEKLSGKKKSSQGEEQGIELADMGEKMGSSITDMLEQMPETVGEGVKWATEQAQLERKAT